MGTLDRSLVIKARKSVVNQLTERLGELPSAFTQKVSKLSLNGLESFSKELPTLENIDRLNNWLDERLDSESGKSSLKSSAA